MGDIVSNSGTVLDHVDYTAYGQVAAESSPAQGDRFKYAGMEFDGAIGLYYDRSRYYDPSAGRFISLDPTGFAASDSDLYRYALNDTINNEDRTGLDIRLETTRQVGGVHQKITIDTRRGPFSISYGCLNPNVPNVGGWYEDKDKPLRVTKTITTTTNQDLKYLYVLQRKLKQPPGWYNPVLQSCITQTSQLFDELQRAVDRDNGK